MYHYTESGLDNVYLKNGYKIHKTVYGEGVSIEDTDGLHKAISKWLVEMPKPLNGAEVRFLRLEMDQTQRDLAAFLGTAEQTVRLWERNRNKAIPGPADRLLRALYLDYLGDFSVRRMLKRLAELDQAAQIKGRFHETPCGWKPLTAPPLGEPPSGGKSATSGRCGGPMVA
jgi:DNA-binding transcriptional regulator YiaG